MGERVAVIGAGITGLFSALYIAQSGQDVTLYDKGIVSSETSDHFHGMIHSGARYAVNDQASAEECITENRTLSEVASDFIEDTGGYFVGFDDAEAEYGDRLIEGCHKTGIPVEEIDPKQFLKYEPYVNNTASRVIRVPDKVVNAFDYSVAVAAEARVLGAKIRQNSRVLRIERDGEKAGGIFFTTPNGTAYEKYDVIVNATGPFSSSLFAESGIPAPAMAPSVGSMLVYHKRYVNSVLNRMRLPSDGDIMVPYGSSSVLGTLATLVEDADEYTVSEDDIEMMKEEGQVMIPAIRDVHEDRIYSSVRPLISDGSDSMRTATRSYEIVDHSEAGFPNLFSITGGKFSSGRLIGEDVGKRVARHFGIAFKPELPDLNTSFERFLQKSGEENMGFLNIVRSRDGTMDQERYRPAIAALVASLLEVN